MDGNIKVKVTHGGTKEPVQFSTNLGSNLQEAIEAWGEDVVYYHFTVGATTSARNALYSMVGNAAGNKDDDGNFSGKSEEEALAEMANWKPSVPQRGERKSAAEKLLEQIAAGALGEDQLEALRAALS